MSTGDDFYGSYNYMVGDEIAEGYLTGKLWANGQVSTHDWLESEDMFGLELTVWNIKVITSHTNGFK